MIQLPIKTDSKTMDRSKNRDYIDAVLTNRQLLQSTLERKQSLILHSNLISNPQFDQVQQMPESQLNSLIKQNKNLLNELFQNHYKGLKIFAKQLIDAQTKIQNQIQMKSIIRQYQDRIQQFRDIMINKEIQLCIEQKTRRMNTIPTHDRIRQLMINQRQEENLKILLKQYYDLKKSVEDLQNQIKSKLVVNNQSSISNNSHLGLPSKAIILDQRCQNKQNKRSQKRIIRRIQRPQKVTEDKVLLRVYKLLQDEIKQQQKLKNQAENLQKKLKEVTNLKKNQIERYNQFQKNEDSILFETQE